MERGRCLFLTMALSDIFWCALQLQEEANDALQPVEVFVRAMTHDHHYHHLLLYVEVSFKFLASFKTVLTMYIKAAFRRAWFCFR